MGAEKTGLSSNDTHYKENSTKNGNQVRNRVQMPDITIENEEAQKLLCALNSATMHPL
jgi:hypothetical protein